MMRKYNSLKEIVSNGLNCHEFVLIKTLEDLIEYSNKNEKYSIRFDSTLRKYSLPFYKYPCNLQEVWDRAIEE